LANALDAIANHPNVGPFIARQLIQRLVTSNPSRGYVYRVAQVFANNGQGVRGDLKAVVRAVLLDWEARAGELLTQQGFGKQREPLLRLANVLRAFNASAPSGRWRMGNLEDPVFGLGQEPYHAPSVFNFFEPTYVQPGEMAQAGLVAPEFQISTGTQAIGSANTLARSIYNGVGSSTDLVTLDVSALLPLVANPPALVDRIDRLLTARSMSATLRNILLTAFNEMVAEGRDDNRKVRTLIQLTVFSPEFVTQR
jgi:uncharacterized protein (DUF1800 family)